jgi:hypothetical protein
VLKTSVTGTATRELTCKINNNGSDTQPVLPQPDTLPPLACSCQCAVTLPYLVVFILSSPDAGQRVCRLSVVLFIKKDIKTPLLRLLLHLRRHLLTRCYTSYYWPVYKRLSPPALSFRIKTTFRPTLYRPCSFPHRDKIQINSIGIRLILNGFPSPFKYLLVHVGDLCE